MAMEALALSSSDRIASEAAISVSIRRKFCRNTVESSLRLLGMQPYNLIIFNMLFGKFRRMVYVSLPRPLELHYRGLMAVRASASI
jgi:hypothetical protein